MVDKYLQVLGAFRQNARMSLTDMSKKTKIPVSTLFNRLRELEEQGIISKHTTLVDFTGLGFGIRSQILVKANSDYKEELQKFLKRHEKVNSSYRINNGYDFFVEAIFKSLEEFDHFISELTALHVVDYKEFFILEELKREAFLSLVD